MASGYTNKLVPPPKDDARSGSLLPVVSSLGLDVPLSPVSPAPAAERTRKFSPLTDLIESEKAYVDLLTGIIRKVAAAWSRTNLPPSQLDGMFRSVEGVFKTNRSLLAKLKEIGENPSSPKVLGDLLMRWIDELEQPYTTYADKYCIGFDDWEPVKANAKLPTVLQAFSASNPPPSTLPQSTHLSNPSLWTLDALFLLPKGRLQYYRKLYSRLLKSTTPGRSDHKLLTVALGKLDDLLETLDNRANIQPQVPHPPYLSTGSSSTPVHKVHFTSEPVENSALLSGQFGVDSASVSTSLRGSFSSEDSPSVHLSQESSLIAVSRRSSQSLSSVLDLERGLITETTLDIFTMQPKQIRLQILSPDLPYARELRLSAKVLVRFTPKTTGVEVIHHHGHIYILSDLFLLCEEVERGEHGQDMHLCYPPLSGKVLSVFEVPGRDNALQVSVMHKETLIMETSSQIKRDQILNEFQECILFAKTISRAAQEPVAPMTPVDPQLPTTRLRARERPDRALNPRLHPPSQPENGLPEQTDNITSPTVWMQPASSPKQNKGAIFSQIRVEKQNVIIPQLEAVQDSGHDVVSSPSSGHASLGNGQRVSTLQNPGPVYPPRRSSAGYTNNSPPFSFITGQVVPPARSASIQPQSPPSGIPALDLPEGQGVYSPRTTTNPTQQTSALRHHASMHSLRQPSHEHQPSLHSLPHRPRYQTSSPAPHTQLELHSSNRQPVPTRSSSPPVPSHPVERSSHRLQKSSSSRSLHVKYQYNQTPVPPMPSLPDGLFMPQRSHSQHKDSTGPLSTPIARPLLPSMQMGSRTGSVAESSILDPSPPTSPTEEHISFGPVRSVITNQMKCKVFHQQQHAQWKSLGSANLTLYRQEPTNIKQLVVETGSKEKSVLISTIVLTDGVERVGKTGVAIELSDAGGARTGVIYMIQLRNENSASQLFKTLLAGSDRAA